MPASSLNGWRMIGGNPSVINGQTILRHRFARRSETLTASPVRHHIHSVLAFLLGEGMKRSVLSDNGKSCKRGR